MPAKRAVRKNVTKHTAAGKRALKKAVKNLVVAKVFQKRGRPLQAKKLQKQGRRAMAKALTHLSHATRIKAQVRANRRGGGGGGSSIWNTLGGIASGVLGFL